MQGSHLPLGHGLPKLWANQDTTRARFIVVDLALKPSIALLHDEALQL